MLGRGLKARTRPPTPGHWRSERHVKRGSNAGVVHALDNAHEDRRQVFQSTAPGPDVTLPQAAALIRSVRSSGDRREDTVEMCMRVGVDLDRLTKYFDIVQQLERCLAVIPGPTTRTRPVLAPKPAWPPLRARGCLDDRPPTRS
jgi:hypothetical protein